METTSLTKRENGQQAVQTHDEAEPARLPVEEMIDRARDVQSLMKELMNEDEHYGTIPGTNKPTLLKPGAEKLNTMFRLDPRFEVDLHEFEATEDRPGGHREYRVHCRMVHIPTSRQWGEGVGSCSTLESKYRYRTAKLSCPECGEETVIKGKEEYGGGWLCWKKKGGCGATWEDGAAAIEGQERGKVENPDIADVYNTVLKMAKKRAHVDAVLTCTSASDIFTQDVEDMPQFQGSSGSNSRPEVGGQGKRQPQRQDAPAPQEEQAATKAQIELVDKLAKSHVWSEKEAEGLKDKIRRISKSDASSYIDKVQAELEARKEAEAQDEDLGPPPEPVQEEGDYPAWMEDGNG